MTSVVLRVVIDVLTMAQCLTFWVYCGLLALVLEQDTMPDIFCAKSMASPTHIRLVEHGGSCCTVRVLECMFMHSERKSHQMKSSEYLAAESL